MTTLKDELMPLAKQYKFDFLIKDLDDNEIFEIVNLEIFENSIDDRMTFETAKERCDKSIGSSIDNMMPIEDQKKLYDMLCKYISNIK